MADKTFHVEVVSAEKSILSVDATAVFARSLEGEIGILAGHQPALLALEIAPITIVAPDQQYKVAVHHGFLFYRDDTLVVLCDMAELSSDIDVARAQRRLEELERHLAMEEDATVRAAWQRQTVRLSLVR